MSLAAPGRRESEEVRIMQRILVHDVDHLSYNAPISETFLAYLKAGLEILSQQRRSDRSLSAKKRAKLGRKLEEMMKELEVP